jgi:hypothetical protein
LRKLVEFEQEFHARELGITPIPAVHDPTIDEAILWYLEFLQRTTDRNFDPAKRPRS